jgi:hypothetical protein
MIRSDGIENSTIDKLSCSFARINEDNSIVNINEIEQDSYSTTKSSSITSENRVKTQQILLEYRIEINV